MTFRSPPLRPEADDLAALLPALSPSERDSALVTARRLVEGARSRADERPYLDAFLQEFGLSNQEGIALMCLAEALLRIPDDETADRLIAEKLVAADTRVVLVKDGDHRLSRPQDIALLEATLAELAGSGP